mmetsp:Transcript_18285/g.55187  ORF Transcript_18285/g.55187 Transcript_18285/m.55187 type:complete len:242 (+) Transcript_18285:74-799(+)
MVRPMNMFCCGFPLTLGVILIMVFNLLQSLFYIATSFCNVILKIPTFGVEGGPMTQTFNGSWAMLGLPFIVVGFWGVAARLETHVRMYFGYLLATFAIDLGFLVANFLVQDVCEEVPTILRRHGNAFACGFMRTASVLVVALWVCIESYLVFTVWSLCEDLKAAPSGSALPDLLRTARESHKHEHRGLADVLYGAPVAPGYPRGYGTLSTQVLGNTGVNIGDRIGHGRYQESSVPPPARYL